MDHLNLLLNIGQLDWVFKGSSSIEKLLDNIVVMMAGICVPMSVLFIFTMT
jgi:hypothetical protein